MQGRVHVYRGQTVGTIVEPRGDNKFGYTLFFLLIGSFDPIFQPEGYTTTLAEVLQMII